MIDETRRVLAEMLTENTGTHMLDSGGANGRSWQQNQGRDFESEPAGTVTGRWGIEATHNIYHWLAERLEYAADLDAELREFSDRSERENESYLSDGEAWIAERFPEAFETFTVNTYNGESALSQVLLFTFVGDPEGDGSYAIDPFYVLSIHGGADVRGGYTRPRVFTELDRGEMALFDGHQVRLRCPRCEAWIESENAGYTWDIVNGEYGGEQAPLYVSAGGANVYCTACLRDDAAIVAVEYGG